MAVEYLWIIGGGLMQLPLVNAARGRDYKIIISDRDPKCICAKQADIFLKLDTYDLPGHMQAARKFTTDKLPIAGVIADAIDVGHISAAVADFLGLPSLTYTVARNLGNKAELARALQAEHPLRLIVERGDWASEAWSHWFKKCNLACIKCLPCVIKSVDNCGSRGVHIVHDLEDFAIAIVDARHNNHDDARILIEEYLVGDEFATDWFVSKSGEVIQTNGARRYFDPEHLTIEVAYTNPWIAPDACRGIARTLAERIGIKYGPFKMDVICPPSRPPSVIEAAGRWSGSFDHTFARLLSCNSNLLDELINWAVGLPVNEATLRIPSEHLWSAVCAPLYKPGRITGFAGLDNAREVLGEYSYIIDRGLRLLPEPTSSAARPLYIIAQSNTEEGALAKAQRASNEVEPIYA
jgi:biotin carboxylase